jgi:GNAT superfamily N-acetyltransferase
VIIKRLDPTFHERDNFDCGEQSLNQFLRVYANQFRERGLGVTWVATQEDAPRRIIGYYTLSMNSVLPAELENPRIHLPRIPVILLGRLAIDLLVQRQGLGSRLLLHALYSSMELSTRIGTYAVVVDPLNTQAAAFYRQHDFEPMPGDPKRLYRSIKNITKSFGALPMTEDFNTRA